MFSLGIPRTGKKCPNGYLFNKKDERCHTKTKKHLSPTPHNPSPNPSPPPPSLHNTSSPQSIIPRTGKKCPNGYTFNKKDGYCHKTRKTMKQLKPPHILSPSPHIPSPHIPSPSPHIPSPSPPHIPSPPPPHILSPSPQSLTSIQHLNVICADSGQCIALGKETTRILSVFDHFNHFNYATNLKRIGKESVNGLVLQIENEKEGYICYTILKSTKEQSSDNLNYEYIAGKFINNINKLYPCFLQTYHLVEFPSILIKNRLFQQKMNKKDKMPILDYLKKQVQFINNEFDLKRACKQARFSGILIQHIANAITLHDFININQRIRQEIIGILLQIYIPLAQLSHMFTHNDLHSNNVLLYKPFENKCIKYQYHLNGRTIHFYSQYIVKIIDYGLCFFETNNQYITKQQLCNEPECKPNCGKNHGFKHTENRLTQDNYYVSKLKNNVSNDLKLLNSFKKYKIPIMNPIAQKVVYETSYGTYPLLRSGLPNHINNVMDAANELIQLGRREEQINIMDFQEIPVAGIMNIYGNHQEMEYVSF
jgi:hypothetical protein